jgi:hypothetical protein
MWPFRRKKRRKETPLPQPAAPPKAEPAAPEPPPTRSAEDVLRELDAESGTIAGPTDPMLGQLLLAEGPVTREYIQEQLAVGGKGNTYVGEVLGDLHAPREADLFRLLADRYHVPELDLKKCKVHVPTARSIPPELVVKYRTVPVNRVGDILCVVFAGEPNPKAIGAIRRATGLCVKAFRCPPHHIEILLRRLYASRPPRRAAAPSRTADTGAATRAAPISPEEHRRVASGQATWAELRWETLYASNGPVRAVRVARR